MRLGILQAPVTVDVTSLITSPLIFLLFCSHAGRLHVRAQEFSDFAIVIPPLHKLLIGSSFSTLNECSLFEERLQAIPGKTSGGFPRKACSHLRETKRSIIYIVVMVCPSLARSFTSSWSSCVIAAWFAESGLG